VWLDQGPARELVYALKYGGWRVAARTMALEVTRRLGRRLREVDALVPVPLGRVRERERGHNQAAELARWVGELAGVPVADGALVRARETRTQTALDPASRRANVSGAFATGQVKVGGFHVALVDDVLTTGATLGAAAEALVRGGAREVGAVTFARAPVPR
jgi:ComF family protein